jgi:hypothetical protein
MSKWTDGEIEFLRINWKRSTHREMGEAINKSATAVRAKCWRLGFVSDRLVGTDKIERIKVWYAAHQGGKLDLKALSVELTMSQGDICKIARRHGLTDVHRTWRQRPKPMYSTKEELRAAMSKRSKAMIKENGHPKGFQGKSHSAETREVISQKSLAAAASKSPEERIAIASKTVATKLQRYGTLTPKSIRNGNAYSNARGGTRDDLGMYFRSAWEANYARYLNWLVSMGKILRWEFEPDEFAFPVKRGCRFYLPDFKVFELDETFSYHEVKGWMDPKSKTKLKRMAIYHPDVKIVLVDQKYYSAIERLLSKTIPNWEFKGDPKRK